MTPAQEEARRDFAVRVNKIKLSQIKSSKKLRYSRFFISEVDGEKGSFKEQPRQKLINIVKSLNLEEPEQDVLFALIDIFRPATLPKRKTKNHKRDFRGRRAEKYSRKTVLCVRYSII